MSHTNSTDFYNLPQFLTGDKPAWLTDINNAFADIDTGIHIAQQKADSGYMLAESAQGDATLAITNAAAADAKGSGAIASIEAAFDPTSVYSVGAKVMYNSLLYKCTVAITTPGPWSGSANWERVTVDQLIPVSAAQLPLTTGSQTTTAEAIDSKADKSEMFKVLQYSKTYSCPANSAINFDNSFISVPSGYSIGATIAYSTNQDSVIVISCRPDDSGQWAFQLRNLSASDKNNQNFSIRLLFIKNELIG